MRGVQVLQGKETHWEVTLVPISQGRVGVVNILVVDLDSCGPDREFEPDSQVRQPLRGNIHSPSNNAVEINILVVDLDSCGPETTEI